MLNTRKREKFGSARTQVGIKEVRDGILVLPFNRYRAILSTSSVNFELQSEEEQDVIVDTFQTVQTRSILKLNHTVLYPAMLIMTVFRIYILLKVTDGMSSRTILPEFIVTWVTAHSRN